MGRGVRPASQNPYPIYDQNLRFSLSYYDLTKNLISYFPIYDLTEGKARVEGGGHDEEVTSSKKKRIQD